MNNNGKLWVESFELPQHLNIRIDKKYEFGEKVEMTSDSKRLRVSRTDEDSGPVPFNLTVCLGRKSWKLTRRVERLKHHKIHHKVQGVLCVSDGTRSVSTSTKLVQVNTGP